MMADVDYRMYLGLTRDELRSWLGEPTSVSTPTRRHRLIGIYKYGDIEYHFDNHGKVFLVYTEQGANRTPLILAQS